MLHTYNTQERARSDKNNKATKKKNKINSERSERPGLYTYTTSGKLQCDFFFIACAMFFGAKSELDAHAMILEFFARQRVICYT